jgi:ornithine decarboxylase
VVEDGCESAVANKISSLTADGDGCAFFVGDLSDIVHKHQVWLSELPQVEPFYAVNCNDDPAVLSVLARLGAGFACANKAEMQKVMNLDVRASHIIYANPCKQSSHIQWAGHQGVDMLTFDSEVELFKIKAKHPNAKLILQVVLQAFDNVDVTEAGIMQFGCHMEQVPHLLSIARQLDLDIVGLSFHIRPGCGHTSTYVDAIMSARAIFDLAAVEGFSFNLLDIGGGFPGHKSSPGLSFGEIAAALRPALEQYFPESEGIHIIAESGQYFVASAFTLAVNIVAQRTVTCNSGADSGYTDTSTNKMNVYYVNDGVYGSFSGLLSGQISSEPSLIEPARFMEEPLHLSSIFGPSCDELDCITGRCLLPQLDVGDWLLFSNMGAYTMNTSAACSGGSWVPACHYVMTEDLWAQLGRHMPPLYSQHCESDSLAYLDR